MDGVSNGPRISSFPPAIAPRHPLAGIHPRQQTTRQGDEVDFYGVYR